MLNLRAMVGTQLARWVLEERQTGQGNSETYAIMSQVGGIRGGHQGLLFPPHSLQAQIILQALAANAPDQRGKIADSWGITLADAAADQGYAPAPCRGQSLHKVVECWNADAFMAFRDVALIAMFEALVRLSALGEVLTVSECATRYGLTTRAVRYAAEAGRVQARKSADGTWLISRAAAEELWGKRND